MQFRLPLDLQLFSDEGTAEPGVESAPAAEVQVETIEDSESQTGVEPQAAAEPEKQNNFEKAFAKRLSAEREKWQSEVSEKYKDYDTLKDVADYFREANQLTDVMTLKEQIELDRLQQRAEKENVPPEVLKRIDQLEVKAAKADELEQQQQEVQHLQSFRSNLEKFAEGKEVKADDLHKYMYDNQIGNMEVAYKAMRADQLEQQLQAKETDVINKYLQSKSAPRVEGAGTPGVVEIDPAKADWKDLRSRTLARIQAATQQT